MIFLKKRSYLNKKLEGFDPWVENETNTRRGGMNTMNRSMMSGKKSVRYVKA
jgi:hypothetical protein